MTAGDQPLPSSSPKHISRQRALFWVILIGLFLVFGYLLYWFITATPQQSTDDAYIQGNQITITSQISGSVVSVNYDNTDLVHKGDVLVTLDKTDAQQNLIKAENSLANTVRQTQQQIINNQQLLANVALEKSQYDKAVADYQRRVQLITNHLISKEELAHAKTAVDSAKASLMIAKQQYQANRAITLTTSLEQQPAILQSASLVRQAWINLQRTQILSPVTGYVAQRNVQVGTQINPGSPLMAVVPADQMWVNANFKETQLSDIRIGQPAEITTDIYGDKLVYKGTVIGLDMGTGSAFSVLPAQNATGNWIKVVQRLPVRIQFTDEQQLAQHPLRIGLSVNATVATANKQGVKLAKTLRQTPAYHTDVLNLDLSQIDQKIEQIIKTNQ